MHGSGNAPRSTAALTVYYDADCGFCTHSALVVQRLDSRRRVRFLPHTEAATRRDAPPRDELQSVLHVVDAEDRWTTGGAAWIQIADRVAALQPLALLARVPPFRSLVEPIYGLVARNRGTLSDILDAAARLVPSSLRPSSAGHATARHAADT